MRPFRAPALRALIAVAAIALVAWLAITVDCKRVRILVVLGLFQRISYALQALILVPGR
ncbi:MAG: hypothetical protein H0W65_11405 [Sphingomonas sp.]|uniref:hypothetical protein n=1 Tax=Sphingomonas sp. TaxID=28214 RepID=UPI0018346A57|nr:hypothetical protein [Sphingomonas sp.]MBA3668306.1 hypothetical protein [Sphingomonas sp.]